jgi:hypothetical protein
MWKGTVMMRLRLDWALLTVGVVLAYASLAQGQGGEPASRPMLSPWFSLYQKNGGLLDNYHMFVRPRFQVNNALQQQQDAIQRNDSGIHSLGQEMTRVQEQALVRPTGSGSVFMSYSHYYPSQGSGGQSATSQGGQRRWAVSRPGSPTRAMPSVPH